MPANLPDSRSYTLTADDPLPSALINEIQDAIIGGWYKGRPSCMPPIVVNNAIGISWQLSAGDFIASTGSGGVQLYVPCDVGDVIYGLELLAQGDGAVDAVIDLNHIDNAMSQTNKGTLADDDRAAAWGVAVVPVTEFAVGANERIRLTVTANAAGYMVGGVFLYRRRGP